jgi:cytochrome c peroxidase
MFAPLPEVMLAPGGPASEALVDLGRMLYYEKRLSKSQQLSCNSCHDLAAFGVDGEPTSDGHKGQTGDRNSPTVYNAAAHVAQFWDGRAPDVEEQAKGPVLNPVEMAMASDHAVVAVLESMPPYIEAFKKAFPNEPKPVTYDNVGKAIGAFERKLVTPSRWDAFLKGDDKALTPEEKAGLKMFAEAGCQVCHAGALVGGSSFQRLGAVKPYPRADDPGRFKVTKVESDRSVFKVPSLRNIEKTGPYFHDGKTATLEAAVRDMGEYQLGRTLTDKEIGQIVVFLRTLTGSLPTAFIREPTLPPSTPATPKPDLR